MKRALFAASAAALLFAAPAGALTRDEVISRAKGFAYHPWTATTANLTASCNTKYRSLYVAGDHVGVAYDWGGYMSLFEFDKEIAQGLGAGSLETDGILACTAGLDCSGFVSQAWGVGHYTTSTMDQASAQIAQAQILPGDVFNQAGYHVAMFTTSLANGEPSLVEALGYNVHVNTTGGWSHVSGYIPRRGNTVTGTTAGNPLGTLVNPIAVSTFPFTDQRDTRQSMSDMLDGCGAAPTINQTGPEYVYALTITQPGTITATVADDATLYYERGPGGFTVHDVTGAAGSVLHLVRAALSRVPFDGDDALAWSDRLPLRPYLPAWLRPLFDLVSPFGGAAIENPVICAVDRGMVMGEIRLLEKAGGKSGHWQAKD